MDVKLTPYLMLNGNAEEAVSFYKDVFDAELESMEFVKDWPEEFDGEIPEGSENSIMHAHLTIGSSSWLMLADLLPGQTFNPGSLMSIMLDIQTLSEAEALFEKSSDGGEILIPLEETGFSPGYGLVKDKFGVEWQIVTDSSDMN